MLSSLTPLVSPVDILEKAVERSSKVLHDKEPVTQPGLCFYSWLFLLEKVTQGWRSVIDLSALSSFVTLMKFQMQTVTSVLESIRKGDWIFSINLKDVYF